ncbi:hypothetical protein N7520_009645 [Penicillium odoratum]|uniref:uncharacterized protein n=1 Tax=Penicillium odoratum TaxID=1167516 RepID=UPI0025471C28|nr:uncharacterized protein N7520_009645 [Penicillium odoratum]KAJ5752728.1 hypothetical protein N7520_009645 [Penicillium odoratum]
MQTFLWLFPSNYHRGRAESPHRELFADRTVCCVSSDVLKREKTALVRCVPSKLLTRLSMGTTDSHIDCVCLGALVVPYRAEIWWLSVELRHNRLATHVHDLQGIAEDQRAEREEEHRKAHDGDCDFRTCSLWR